jgi:FtsZ-binding cell division protein ZapB
MSYEMVSRQENEIKSAFEDVDFIRAELEETYSNKSACSLDKIFLLYSKASLKEICARGAYANMVLISAQNDVNLNKINAMNDWIYRIQNDTKVLNEAQRLKDSQSTLSTAKNIRKKNLFNLNRAKAILKADQKAFAAGKICGVLFSVVAVVFLFFTALYISLSIFDD